MRLSIWIIRLSETDWKRNDEKFSKNALWGMHDRWQVAKLCKKLVPFARWLREFRN